MQEKDLHQSIMNSLSVPENISEFFSQVEEFKKSIMKYQCVIRKLQSKLEILNDELSIKKERNPIEMIKYRVKEPRSIVEKLKRRGYPITVEAMEDHLTDIAGIRVICSFIEDIYTVSEILREQDDIHILQIKDYIKNPKPNGYRSFHMIVETPVFFTRNKEPLCAEIQLRTMAMDFWASLEQQLKYKKNIKNPEIIASQLKDCAQIISSADLKMQDILNQLNK